MGGGRAKSVVPVAGMLLPWLVVKLPGKEFLLGLLVRSLTLLSDDCPRLPPTTLPGAGGRAGRFM